MHGRLYPLAAMVGQTALKQGLLIGAVNPAVGGVLIRGPKGTGKSTAVRALAALLPEIDVVADCAFACDPARPESLCPQCRRRYPDLSVRRRKVQVVTLPLNATEDRVAGGLDFTGTLRRGARCLSPGLLARAHRGILYVDEVNLLDASIAGLILDAAAAGRHRIEREGLSAVHPCRFLLVGTMNPEEGELSPQLLDRFGLCVQIEAVRTPEQRVRLMVRREAFDADRVGFAARFSAESDRLARRIAAARRRLPQLKLAGRLRGLIAALCTEHHVAGHRADLVMEQAARALAALEGQTEVTAAHVRRAAALVLTHRRRESRPQPPATGAGSRDREPPAGPRETAAPAGGRDSGRPDSGPAGSDPAPGPPAHRRRAMPSGSFRSAPFSRSNPSRWPGTAARGREPDDARPAVLSESRAVT
jgi:magnesium chelatase subunit D